MIIFYSEYDATPRLPASLSRALLYRSRSDPHRSCVCQSLAIESLPLFCPCICVLIMNATMIFILCEFCEPFSKSRYLDETLKYNVIFPTSKSDCLFSERVLERNVRLSDSYLKVVPKQVRDRNAIRPVPKSSVSHRSLTDRSRDTRRQAAHNSQKRGNGATITKSDSSDRSVPFFVEKYVFYQ